MWCIWSQDTSIWSEYAKLTLKRRHSQLIAQYRLRLRQWNVNSSKWESIWPVSSLRAKILHKQAANQNRQQDRLISTLIRKNSRPLQPIAIFNFNLDLFYKVNRLKDVVVLAKQHLSDVNNDWQILKAVCPSVCTQAYLNLNKIFYNSPQFSLT